MVALGWIGNASEMKGVFGSFSGCVIWICCQYVA